MKYRTSHYEILFVFVYNRKFFRLLSSCHGDYICLALFFGGANILKKRKWSQCAQCVSRALCNIPPKGWNERRVGVIVLHVLRRQNTERTLKEECWIVFGMSQKEEKRNVISQRLLDHQQFSYIYSRKISKRSRISSFLVCVIAQILDVGTLIVKNKRADSKNWFVSFREWTAKKTS